MDEVDTPAGIIRVGLAHGTVTGFGSDDKEFSELHQPKSANSCGPCLPGPGRLARAEKINNRVWYSGTPRPTLLMSKVVDGRSWWKSKVLMQFPSLHQLRLVTIDG